MGKDTSFLMYPFNNLFITFRVERRGGVREIVGQGIFWNYSSWEKKDEGPSKTGAVDGTVPVWVFRQLKKGLCS